MGITPQEMLLILIVAIGFAAGIVAVYRSKRYTESQKLYWYFVIFVFNVLGVATYFLEDYLLKRQKR